MLAAEHLLDALAAAGVAAVLCKRDGRGFAAHTRTPQFLRVMHALTGELDESSLLASIAREWPSGGAQRPFVLAGGGESWHCVIQPVDDTCVALLRVAETVEAVDDTFYSMVENLPDVITRHDRQFRYVYVNPAAEAATGVQGSTRIGKNHRELGAPPELVEIFESAYERVFTTGEAVVDEFSFSGVTGLRHYVGWAVPEFDHDGQVQTVLSIVRDISEIKRLQDQLTLLSRTDSLTALLNRRGFVEDLDAALQSARGGQITLSVLMLDVDNFKDINDRFGHVVGDEVLQGIGRVLEGEAGSPHIAARLGGDEFCVALVGLATEAARSVADLICLAINDIKVGSDPQVSVEVSIGIEESVDNDDSAAALIARVDASMYRVKQGKGKPTRAPGGS
jgi:diguanylate cyclase (GGDEF)-like protein/PAS domain S-box-containing protein